MNSETSSAISVVSVPRSLVLTKEEVFNSVPENCLTILERPPVTEFMDRQIAEDVNNNNGQYPVLTIDEDLCFGLKAFPKDPSDVLNALHRIDSDDGHNSLNSKLSHHSCVSRGTCSYASLDSCELD